MRIAFTLPVVPRTKKTSNRIIGMGRRCNCCGKHEIQRVMPSEQFEALLADCLWLASQVKDLIEKASPGIQLPLVDPVHCCAQFYRDADAGDPLGYEQALGDILQAPRWKCSKRGCGKIARAGEDCSCGALWGTMKESRKGMGIIDDDVQIRHWDGTRLHVDTARPRIEIVLTTLDPPLLSEL